jgi:acylphosphatase
VRCCSVTIRGRVQGVGFRAGLRYEARRAGLRGWVRNRVDGTVEALICGDEAAVDGLLEWAARGPPGSRVESMDVREASRPTSLAMQTNS